MMIQENSRTRSLVKVFEIFSEGIFGNETAAVAEKIGYL